jgi:arabinoxylan arabinofuranohydrolase
VSHRSACLASILCAAALFPSDARALNPIVQTIYTADPAPLVHDGRVYLYTGHDEDGSTYFTMRDWWVFSSADMVNWTAHGSPLSLSSFTWASRDAWAGQCIERNGKFYWYVPVRATSGATQIGVAVADSPTGPFADALGHPLVSNAQIDPTVFIDDDGQAYLYYGNPDLYYVKLNEDMISYAGSPVKVPLTPESFGVRSKTDRPTQYEEGPWLFKRSGTYYMVFTGGPISEHISYSTGPTATGPWTFGGVIMPTQGTSFTNHAGIADFAGNSYFFYHNGALPGGGGYTRSVAVESFTYGEDGTIPTINMTSAGVSPVATLDPYARVEAETIAWEKGVELEATSDDDGGLDVTQISHGDYIRVMNVDFDAGAASFEARVAADSSGGNIELRLDGATGALLGTCIVPRTGGWQTWATVSCKVTGATGIHDLYLVFTGGSGDLFNLGWWQFTRAAGGDTQPPSTPGGLSASATTAGSVSLTWEASTDDVGVIGYLVLRGSSPAVPVGATSGTSFQVTGLTPSTSYDFTVQAVDAAANASTASSPLTVATTADTTPPAVPSNLTASGLTPSAVTLTWTASTDDIGVAAYVIYAKVGAADRVELGTADGGTTTFDVTGLSTDTTYILSVEATDEAGNHSAPATTTVTTPAAPSSGGGGCGQGSAPGWVLAVLTLWLVSTRRRADRPGMG